MNRAWLAGFALLGSVLLALAGCGGQGAGPAAVSISLTSSTPQEIDQSQRISTTANVTNDSSNQGVVWTVSCPPSLCGTVAPVSTASGSPTTYTAPPNVQSVETVMLTASSVADSTKTASVSITVHPAPAIATTSPMPSGTEGMSYSQTLAVTGGVAPYTFSSSGAFPAGLALNTTTGAITGIPTAWSASPANFTVTVTDSSSAGDSTAAQQLAITISAPPPVAISPAGSALPAGTLGTGYSTTLTVSGGLANYTWMLMGNLPAGLTSVTSSDTKSLTITGTPTSSVGTFSFQLKAADSSNPAQSDTQSYSIKVNAGVPKIAPSSGTLPNATQNAAYSTALTVSGGLANYTWAVIGNLPSGLTGTTSADTRSYTISGTTGHIGPSSFQISVTDSNNPAQSDTESYILNINSVPYLVPQGGIGCCGGPPPGTQGTPYSQTLRVVNGLPPYSNWTISSGALPTGLSLLVGGSSNGHAATLSGIPGAQGRFSFAVSVDDSSNPPQTATANYSVTINAATTLAITTTALPGGSYQNTYTATVSATGGTAPYTFSVDSSGAQLPTGFTLTTNASTNRGIISGTPSSTGTTTGIIIDVTDSASPANKAQQTYSLTVSPGCGTGSESLLNGQYAFLLKGFDNESYPEPALVGGVFTANGAGTVSTGTLDMNLDAGVQTNLNVSSGSYSIGPDQRGCMTLNTSIGSYFYAFSLGSVSGSPLVASTGHMIGLDDNGPFTTGILRKQDPTAFSTSKVTGTYAFGVSFFQNTSNDYGGTFAAAGTLSLSNGIVTRGVEDVNANGTLNDTATNINTWSSLSPLSITGGSYSISNANGRGTLSFQSSGFSNPINVVIYVVSSSEVLMLSSDNQAANFIFAGKALLQSGSPFSNAALNGISVVYIANTNNMEIGTVTTDGNGGLQYLTWRDGDGVSRQGTASYSVAPNGRVNLTNFNGLTTPVFWLVNTNEAFFLGNQSGEMGMLEPQAGTSTSGSLAFGTIDPATSGNQIQSGVLALSGGTVNITTDENPGPASMDQVSGQTYSIDSTGLGSIPSGCSFGTNCQSLFYVISPTRTVFLNLQFQIFGQPAAAVQVGDQ